MMLYEGERKYAFALPELIDIGRDVFNEREAARRAILDENQRCARCRSFRCPGHFREEHCINVSRDGEILPSRRGGVA